MNNIKQFIEKVNDNKTEMKNIVDVCNTEGRAMTAEEIEKFDALEAEAKDLQKTIDRMQDADAVQLIDAPVVESTEIPQEDRDVADFANYVRARVKGMPVQSNITRADNGDVIPTTIANKIIDRVKEISPVFESMTKFNVKGSLYVPYIAASDDNIAADYAAEFTDAAATSIAFSSVKLGNFLFAVNTAISKSLINNTDIGITEFVVEKMAKAIAAFVEKEALIGTQNKIEGMRGLDAAQIVTSETTNTIKADDIIELMAKVKTPYQQNAYFIMNPATLTALRKIKTADGIYILNTDATSEFGFRVFGKEVYVSDNMPAAASNALAVYYGDFGEGLVANITEDLELQVLNEKYATQHAIGITGWMEADIKVQNQQAVAALKVK